MSAIVRKTYPVQKLMTKKEMEAEPAPPQVDMSILENLGANRGGGDGGMSYNIWYNKWSGDRDNYGRERAEYRCKVSRDCGWTLGTKDLTAPLCLFFARGCCPYGKDCKYKHRIPVWEDREEVPVDCFGRERFGEFRNDMSGVGAFSRENLTLYVGRIGNYDDIEEVVWRHFSEWGEIDTVKVLYSKCVAFVQYKRRTNAEFAKEAMANQSLDKEEILNLRWAIEDPNPRAREDNRQRNEQRVYEALTNALPAHVIDAILDGDENGEESAKRHLENVENDQSLEGNKRQMLEAPKDSEQNSATEQPVANNQVQQQYEEEEEDNGFLSKRVLQSISQFAKNLNNDSLPKKESATRDQPAALSLLSNQYDSDSEVESD